MKEDDDDTKASAATLNEQDSPVLAAQTGLQMALAVDRRPDASAHANDGQYVIEEGLLTNAWADLWTAAATAGGQTLIPTPASRSIAPSYSDRAMHGMDRSWQAGVVPSTVPRDPTPPQWTDALEPAHAHAGRVRNANKMAETRSGAIGLERGGQYDASILQAQSIPQQHRTSKESQLPPLTTTAGVQFLPRASPQYFPTVASGDARASPSARLNILSDFLRSIAPPVHPNAQTGHVQHSDYSTGHPCDARARSKSQTAWRLPPSTAYNVDTTDSGSARQSNSDHTEERHSKVHVRSREEGTHTVEVLSPIGAVNDSGPLYGHAAANLSHGKPDTWPLISPRVLPEQSYFPSLMAQLDALERLSACNSSVAGNEPEEYAGSDDDSFAEEKDDASETIHNDGSEMPAEPTRRWMGEDGSREHVSGTRGDQASPTSVQQPAFSNDIHNFDTVEGARRHSNDATETRHNAQMNALRLSRKRKRPSESPISHDRATEESAPASRIGHFVRARTQRDQQDWSDASTHGMHGANGGDNFAFSPLLGDSVPPPSLSLEMLPHTLNESYLQNELSPITFSAFDQPTSAYFQEAQDGRAIGRFIPPSASQWLDVGTPAEYHRTGAVYPQHQQPSGNIVTTDATVASGHRAENTTATKSKPISNHMMQAIVDAALVKSEDRKRQSDIAEMVKSRIYGAYYKPNSQ
eukprot:Opistho-2@28215